MNFLQTISFVISSSIRHPRTPIVLPNPGTVVSPVPWSISLIVMAVGIIAWCMAEKFEITGLGEAARLMVYGPIGNMFGLGTSLKQKKNNNG